MLLLLLQDGLQVAERGEIEAHRAVTVGGGGDGGRCRRRRCRRREQRLIGHAAAVEQLKERGVRRRKKGAKIAHRGGARRRRQRAEAEICKCRNRRRRRRRRRRRGRRCGCGSCVRRLAGRIEKFGENRRGVWCRRRCREGVELAGANRRRRHRCIERRLLFGPTIVVRFVSLRRGERAADGALNVRLRARDRRCSVAERRRPKRIDRVRHSRRTDYRAAIKRRVVDAAKINAAF